MLPLFVDEWVNIGKNALRTIFYMCVLLVLVGVVFSIRNSIVDAQQATRDLEANKATIANLRQELTDANASLEAERRNIKIVTEYVDRVQTVRVRGETIIKEVPIYVTQEADARCVVPNGFVWLHNAAATNATAVANPAQPPHAGASGVALSEVAATVAYNYQQFHELREQVVGLQHFIRENSSEPTESQ